MLSYVYKLKKLCDSIKDSFIFMYDLPFVNRCRQRHVGKLPEKNPN